MSKKQQKKYLKEIMEADEKDGIYMSKTPEEYEELIKRIDAYNKSVIDKFIEGKVKEFEEEIHGADGDYDGYVDGLIEAIKILKQ